MPNEDRDQDRSGLSHPSVVSRITLSPEGGRTVRRLLSFRAGGRTVRVARVGYGPGAIWTLDRPVSKRNWSSYEPVALTELPAHRGSELRARSFSGSKSLALSSYCPNLTSIQKPLSRSPLQ